ncbi:MAG: hypothetical protein DIU65_16060 [Proteobacteria bacterium]|nr:MAG: hypothetical protein DIU65_16060 [Pseudomonadota bacterium]
MNVDADITEHQPRRSDALVRRIAVHEASHAVARLVFDLDTVTGISIDAPHGGYVEARTGIYHENTLEFLSAHLALMLAGRASEQEFLDSVGANNNGETLGSDHEIATKLAHDMETSMGFAEDMPLLYRRCEDWTSHLATNPELAARVNRRLEDAYAVARKVVRAQAAAISYLRNQLMAHGTLEGARLESVLAETSRLITR